jgi:hypothetical protein
MSEAVDYCLMTLCKLALSQVNRQPFQAAHIEIVNELYDFHNISIDDRRPQEDLLTCVSVGLGSSTTGQSPWLPRTDFDLGIYMMSRDSMGISALEP